MIEASATALLNSVVNDIVVVTGHQHQAIESTLADTSLRFAHNADFASGMAGSLATGIQALSSHDGVVVALGDMPEVEADVIDALVSEFAARPRSHYVVPTYHGRRGNPVLLSSAVFGKVLALQGDTGARSLWSGAGADLLEVATSCAGVLRDFDTLAELESVTDDIR